MQNQKDDRVMGEPMSTHAKIGKVSLGSRKTLSNTALCPAMRPFGTLAEVMRMKQIAYLEIIPGIAHMTLEHPDPLKEWKREGLLHLKRIEDSKTGEDKFLIIRSQDQYDKYVENAYLERTINPWSFDDIRQCAQDKVQELFQRGYLAKYQKKMLLEPQKPVLN